MSLDPVTTIPGSSCGAVPVVTAQQDNLRWFELSLVLLVAFGGSLAGSIHVLTHSPAQWAPFTNERWMVSAIHEVSCLGLLGYVLHRRGLKIRDLGMIWSRQAVIVGVCLFGVACVSYSLGLWLIQMGQHFVTGTYVTPVHAAQIFGHPGIMAFLFTFLNPFFEELIVRAYLMSEVSRLTGSMALATVVSVLLQSSYHLYYGWTGAGAMAFLFVVFAVYYARTRKATPVIIAHFLFDILAVARLAHLNS